MATAAIGVSANRMSVGRVFERAFATIRHNPLVTIALALLFGGLPIFAVEYYLSQIPPEAFYMTIGSTYLPGAVPIAMAKWFGGLVVSTIALGAMTRPVVDFSYGNKASLGGSLLAVLRNIGSLLFLGIMLGLCVIVGTTLLIVPAVIVYLLWVVAAPALVEERDGVFLSLSRSQELSEGARWKCLGVLLLVMIPHIILYVILAAALRAVDPTTTFNGAAATIIIVIATLVQLLWSTVQASLYVELRDWKEGPGESSLEDVFA
jgi:hypothetical protein